MDFRVRRGQGRAWSAAGICLLLTSSARPAGPWDTALRARARLEASPHSAHTRAAYMLVMNGFRLVYHNDPADSHAARAVEQVAELLAEEGHEFGDRKALLDAAGQYQFLARAYPNFSGAQADLKKASDLLGPEGMNDRAAARALRSQMEKQFPGRRPATTGSGPAALRNDTQAVESLAIPGDSKSSPPRPEPRVEASPEPQLPGPVALVTGVRHWSTGTYTRVAIDLGSTDDQVRYQAVRVENPNRIFFDIHHARVSPQLEGKSFAVTDDGFLTRIRAAQFSSDVARIVLDVHAVGEYSAFLLPNPTRLIIDIHARAGSRETAPATREESAVRAPAVPPPGEKASSLPPMPVTDGSAAFGLPARGTSAPSRVVVPTKPTTARPVPNAVATATPDGAGDIAAVGVQSGRVEATRQPTSAPVTNRKAAGRSAPREAASPAAEPLPTAAGERSLMRALGLKIGRIVIDAGHGGHDSGTLGFGGIEEKDVVLDVALRLGRLLHDRLGAAIVYTRADDTFIPLETRTAIANKAQADLFISVHANSSPDASARGVEVYYLNFTSDPDAMTVAGRENAVSTQSVHELSDLVKKIALKDKIDESRELAGDVDTALYAGLRKGNEGLHDRGVKKAPFVVLIGANMPSILAEISFVTNPDDAEQLSRPEYRQRVAESLCKGVERYAAGLSGGRKTSSPMQAAK